MNTVSRIYLIGFMGCGKSYFGRKLASETGMQLIDLDKFIEESQHATIPQLFQKYGEQGFRTIEKKALEEVSNFENTIISTGGGAPCFFDNMDIMNHSGLTVWLNPSVEVIRERLIHSKNPRPLIAGKTPEELQAFIIEMLEKRSEFYRRAKLNIDPVTEPAPLFAKRMGY